MFSKKIKIGNSCVGDSCPAYIVAEISCNHNNSIEKGVELINLAKESGANAVKLQTYRADSITLNVSNKKDFLINSNSPWSSFETLYSLFERVAMPWEWHERLFKEARRVGIDIFSSPFCLEGVNELDQYGTDAYKIASPEIYHHELIEACMRKGKPVIISLGVADLKDTLEIVNMAERLNFKDLILLKCTATYPAALNSLNLITINDMMKRFSCVVGFSDHTIGEAADIVAVSLGAKIIEKHIKLTNDDGVDGFFSTSVSDFKRMVTKIREVESILGDVDYSIPEDVKVDYRGRRSLYFSKNLSENDLITNESIAVVRPALGLHPKYKGMILNKHVNVAIESGDRVQFDLIKNSTVNVSIIGLGAIGAGFGGPIDVASITNHLSYMMSDERFNILCGVDPNEACRIDFTEKTGLNAYGTIEECLHLLAQSDILILSESSASRASNFITLNKSLFDKIFLLEKPVASNLAEALEMAAAIGDTNNKIFVNYQRRVNPNFKFLKKLIQTERNISVTCRYSGTYLNIGTHFLDLFLFFTGDHTFSRSDLADIGIQIFETNGHRLVLEQIQVVEYYCMSIVSESYIISIDFSDGEVKIFECNSTQVTKLVFDNNYYFQHVGEELINSYNNKGDVCFTSFHNAIKYLE